LYDSELNQKATWQAKSTENDYTEKDHGEAVEIRARVQNVMKRVRNKDGESVMSKTTVLVGDNSIGDDDLINGLPIIGRADAIDMDGTKLGEEFYL